MLLAPVLQTDICLRLGGDVDHENILKLTIYNMKEKYVKLYFWETSEHL